MSLLSNFGAIKESAPRMFGEFLDGILNEHRSQLKPEAGESQLCFMVNPLDKKNENDPKETRQFDLLVVTLDDSNRILRVLSHSRLSDVLTNLLTNLPNA